MEYHQKHDGEWDDVTDGKFTVCCDCGLVHFYEFAVLDGRILRRAWRDKRMTASRRRSKEVIKSLKRIKESEQ